MRVHRPLGSHIAPALLAVTVVVAEAGRAEPLPLTGITSTAAHVTTLYMPEATAAVFGPGEHPKCPAGRLLLGSGGRVRSLDLTGGDATNTELKPLVGEAITSFIKDNHLIRIDEDLVYAAFGYTHEALPCMSGPRPCAKPVWWDVFAEYPVNGHTKPGARSAIWIFRSPDCGTTWTLVGRIDAALLPVVTTTGQTIKGLCGPPRPREEKVCKDDEEKDLSSCPRPSQRVLKKWADLGGFDGHYLAGYEESGRLVVSTLCVFGTKLTPGDETRLHILATSDDGGATWSARVVPRLDDPKATVRGLWRAPVMPLDNDLWVFAYNEGTTVRVVADDPLAGIFAQAQSIVIGEWTDLKKAEPVPLDTNLHAIGRELALNLIPVGSTKPPGSPVVRPLVQLGSHTWIDGRLPRFRVHNVDLESGDVTTATPLIAPADSGESVLQGSFIQGRRATLYYWLEERTGGKFRVRYQVYHRGTPMLTKGFLPTESPGIVEHSGGGDHTFSGSKAKFHGDYMKGAHYVTAKGTEHFFLVWNEIGNAAFAEVRVHGLDDAP